MKKKGTYSTSSESISNPFAALLGDRTLEVKETPNSVSNEAKPPEVAEEKDGIRGARFWIRMERKGRGGKTITLLGGAQVDSDSLGTLARRLGKKLGCGAFVEDGCIVFQGDQRPRLPGLLEALGAAKVKVG
jgi:translation initiation factor 1